MPSQRAQIMLENISEWKMRLYIKIKFSIIIAIQDSIISMLFRGEAEPQSLLPQLNKFIFCLFFDILFIKHLPFSIFEIFSDEMRFFGIILASTLFVYNLNKLNELKHDISSFIPDKLNI